MSEAEYYYIDKGVRRPLKLLSDTVALRLSNGAKWEQFDLFVERKLASAAKGSIFL